MQRNGVDVRKELLDFHRRFYFAEVMKLVVWDNYKSLGEITVFRDLLAFSFSAVYCAVMCFRQPVFFSFFFLR